MAKEQLAIQFSKMQCLLTGNRFSGVNLAKTRYDFDPHRSVKGITIAVVFTITIDYLEIEDQVKYMHHATLEVKDDVFKSGNTLKFLKEVITEIQNELVLRYDTSQIFKFLEMDYRPDKMQDEYLSDRIGRIISDYNNGKI
jgi:hypoxanthine phosphoribosyltransferase